MGGARGGGMGGAGGQQAVKGKPTQRSVTGSAAISAEAGMTSAGVGGAGGGSRDPLKKPRRSPLTPPTLGPGPVFQNGLAFPGTLGGG